MQGIGTILLYDCHDDVVNAPVTKENDNNQLSQMQWQIINIGLLDSMGDRSSFVHSYHTLARANNLDTIIIPENLLLKLSTPYTMSKILIKHLEEFHQKLMIDNNNLNTDSVMEGKSKDKGSKTAIADKLNNQDKKCRPPKSKAKNQRLRERKVLPP